jgi:hypothetical protein
MNMRRNESTDIRRPANELGNGNPGPFLAKVVHVVDPEYMGKIRVQILHVGSNGSTTNGELAWASYMSPFFGTTDDKYLGQSNSGKSAYDDTQKSYGMWVPTPDIGTTVIVMFIEGMANKGYWFGCAPERYKNFMVPGLAATSLNTDYLPQESRVPVAEYNSKVNTQPGDAPTNAIKPVHPYIFKSLKKQGLIDDDIRGITSSSARRESPSRVWGISTAGPVDKNGPTGEIGSPEETAQAAHSRLGGSSFVMDDGDEKFIRDKPASEAPPKYNYVKPKSPPIGDTTIPHNELIRLRTRTGHQILLHNSEDLIYIGNAKGTAWIELTSNGKIDIFAADSISIHTKADLNIRADRDINLEAGRNVNIKSVKNTHIESDDKFELVVGSDGYITTKFNLHVNSKGDNLFSAKGDTHINSGGNHAETAGEQIHMNSTITAKLADFTIPLTTTRVPDVYGSTKSILRRIPEKEPWIHHENLDPVQFKSDNTDRDVTTEFTVPDYFTNYTAPMDTFKQGKK